jgi:hypothetical protein
VRTTIDVPAVVATGTKAEADDAKSAKIARIRAIMLMVYKVLCIIVAGVGLFFSPNRVTQMVTFFSLHSTPYSKIKKIEFNEIYTDEYRHNHIS